MEKDFRLTSSEYAKLHDLSVEALRSRRRRELESGNFICVEGKYWWKRDRPIAVSKKVNSRSIPGPGAVNYGPRKRNRGALARGEKPDYPNWKMEERNQVLALAKIRDNLGDEVVDEITPELFDLAKSNSGGIVSKSCTLHHRIGNPKPRYYDTEHLSINSTGLANEGYEFYNNIGKTIKEYKPYFISVAGVENGENFFIIDNLQ